MATKTISVDLEAYELLKKARGSVNDSFSQVIKRARWDKSTRTCGDLLESLSKIPVVDDQVLDRLDAAQRADSPPDEHRR